MNKGQQKKMIWVVTWGILLLLVLYSPIGSPDLYRTSDLYYQGQGVQFNGQGIKNATNFQTSIDNNSDNFITASPSESRVVTSYNYSSVASKRSSSHNSNISSGSNYARNNRNQTPSGYMGGGSNLYLRSQSSASFAVAPKMSSVSSSDLLVAEGQTGRQGASTATTATGGTDPGGDPDGDPIPVGEGIFVMLFFVVLYIVYKKKLL